MSDTRTRTALPVCRSPPDPTYSRIRHIPPEAHLARLVGIPLPVRLFLHALTSPRVMGGGMPGLRILQRTGLPQLFEGRGGAFVPASIRAALRLGPSLLARPYRARPVPLHQDRTRPRGTVAYFAGCIMNS